MNIRRISILIVLLIILVSDAGMRAAAAESTQTGTTGAKNYTVDELCCMAQYYYKRTDEEGFYPPEAAYRKEEDGTYLIVLRGPEGDQEGKYIIYASYSLNANGKGTDEKSGKLIDLTLYSKVYTPEELCKLSQEFYYKTYDFYPPNADYAANEDGTYTICLYEVINDAEGVAHNSTCGWFTVNVCGIGQDDMLLEMIDINP